MFVVFDTEAKTIAENFLENGVSYVGVYRSDTDKITGYFEDEVLKLKKDFEEAEIIVGYNIYGYDFPVLKPYFEVNLKGKKVVDIYKLVLQQHKIHLKLDNLASTTFNKSKIAHGLDAVRFYREGKLDKLKKYCDMDVELTKNLYNFIIKNGYAFYTDGLGKKVKLEINLGIEENLSESRDAGSLGGGLF